MSRRVLVTGAQGFLGRYLVAHLLRADPDVQVFGLGRSPRLDNVFTHSVHWGTSTIPAPLPATVGAALQTPRYHYVSVDLERPAEIVPALRDFRPDVIVHLASALRDAPTPHLFRTNVEGTIYLVEALQEAGIACPRVVFGSTGFIYGRVPPTALPIDEHVPCVPIDHYGVSKLASEHAARLLTERYMIPAMWARIFNLVGPGQEERHLCGWVTSQAAAIAAGVRPPVMEIGPLDTTRDFIDVRDAAAALDLVARRGEPGTVYNVASGQESSVATVFHAILDGAGLVDRVRMEEKARRPADIHRYVASIERLRALGFRPSHPLERSLIELLTYYREDVARAAARSHMPVPAAAGSTAVDVVAAARHQYQVAVAPGLLAAVPDRLRTMFPSARIVVLTDRRVHELHGRDFLERLRASHQDADAIVIPEGERSKSSDRLQEVIERLHAARFDRRAVLVNLGGGVITDLGGLAAAVYMRGVSYVNVPTTLLAQHDAGVGGKVAINMPWAKNFVGAFHHPRAVFCDPCVLATLGARDLAAGVAEALKVAIIASPTLFELIETHVKAIRDERNAGVLTELLGWAIRAKAELLASDPYEANLRRVLNLGHTFGHALEVQTGYEKLLHGEAVAFGIAVATAVARRRGLCSTLVAQRIYAALHSYDLPPRVPRPELDAATALLDDIRLVRGRALHYVLPCSIGAVEIVPELEDHEITGALDDLAADPVFGGCIAVEPGATVAPGSASAR